MNAQMRIVVDRYRSVLYAAAAMLAAVAAFVPTPYALMLPGRAVDLRGVVRMQGYPPLRMPYYLTDVRFAPHATVLQLSAGFFPGAQIVRASTIVASSLDSIRYEGLEREAMSEAESIAAAVAERAAGLRVPPVHSRVLIVYFAPGSHAQPQLHALDMLVGVNGRRISTNQDVVAALRSVPAGSNVQITVFRNGRERIQSVRTIKYGTRTALGVYLTTIFERPDIPLVVTYHLPGVGGSSGGLMFALEIYRRLHPRALRDDVAVAGTGTIDYDGTVGAIEGVRQKVVAAERAHAQFFLVPRENYAAVAQTTGIRIIPVSNFSQAVEALTTRGR
jgi:PDZ domain-containing protein